MTITTDKNPSQDNPHPEDRTTRSIRHTDSVRSKTEAIQTMWTNQKAEHKECISG